MIFTLGYIGTLGLPKQKIPVTTPIITGWRRFSYYLVALHVRLAYVAQGFWRVKTVGQPATFDQAPIRIYAPHTGFTDSICQSLFYFQQGGFDFLAPIVKASLATSLNFINLAEPLWVVRKYYKKDQQQEVGGVSLTQTLEQRIQYQPQPGQRRFDPIMVNSQGTCSAPHCLTRFKLGAFIPGKPVQPVFIEYDRNQPFLTGWVDICADKELPLIYSFINTFLRLNANLTFHFLPVYHPSPQEISDPELYAENVRKLIAQYGDLALIDTCVEDMRIIRVVGYKYKYNPNYGLIEFDRLKSENHNSKICTVVNCEKAVHFYLKKFETYFKKFGIRNMKVPVAEFFQEFPEMDLTYFSRVKYANEKFIDLPNFVEAEVQNSFQLSKIL